VKYCPIPRWSNERECGKLFRVPMKAANAAVDYVVKNGKRTAVILPIAEYEELLQDLDDLVVIVRRKNEPTIPLAEVKRRLKKNGALGRAAIGSLQGTRR
jgi:hypothetical protein